VLNARYIKRFEDWNPQVELFVVANNIFDEQAVGCGGGNPGSESFYPYPGINVFVGVNVNF
jgi:outer membrane receptor protein involved in Fe transport